MYDAKAGFCTTICPVLPVERPYGQRPLFDLGNPRCPACNACTSKGCIDLSPARSIAQALGRADHRIVVEVQFWGLRRVIPRFYFRVLRDQRYDHRLGGSIYLVVGLWAAASYIVFATLIMGVRLAAAAATTLLAGTAAAVYYWFAAPAIAESLGLPRVFTMAIRIGVWDSWQYGSSDQPIGGQV